MGLKQVWPEPGTCTMPARGGTHRRPTSCPVRSRSLLCLLRQPRLPTTARNTAKSVCRLRWSPGEHWLETHLLSSARTGSPFSKILFFFSTPNNPFNRGVDSSERYLDSRGRLLLQRRFRAIPLGSRPILVAVASLQATCPQQISSSHTSCFSTRRQRWLQLLPRNHLRSFHLLSVVVDPC